MATRKSTGRKGTFETSRTTAVPKSGLTQPDPSDSQTPAERAVGYSKRTSQMSDTAQTLPEHWTTLTAAASVMATPILITDAERVIRFANKSANEMFRSVGQIMQTAGMRNSISALEGTHIDALSSTMGQGQGGQRNFHVAYSDTLTVGPVHIKFSSAPFLDPAGEYAGSLVEFDDQSEQKASEAKRLHAEEEFNSLLKEIRHMSEAHEAGGIEVKIDASQFTIPTIGDAARSINDTVSGHVDVQRTVIEVMEAFGAGNFDAQIERFEGRRGFINKAVDSVRDNFREVVSEIARLSDAINSGKLDVRPDLSKFTGDYRDIVQSFEAAFTGLNSAFGLMDEQIEQVSVSVEQMTHASQILSTSSQVASASVEEVSASIAQTDQQVRANAESSRQAAEFVEVAVGLTQKGTQQIDGMVDAMKGIKTSSEDIAKIIKVIDEIAFQTNLLALNAAVEAARAGQHGRGFAVVAQEVRNLAGRSAKAAKETSDLIADASNRVGSGVRIADETSDAFKGIAEQINQVKDMVAEIDRSSEEQSRGVAQISLAMGEISKAAMDTSQQADELAAGATEMGAATSTMKSEVRRFVLRPREKSDDAIAGLGFPPEIMAKIKLMLNENEVVHQPARINSSLDRDERGFGSF